MQTCSLSTHGFVCSLIIMASEHSGCYLNSRFINRPGYCCSRQRELTHLVTCLKKRSEERHTHTHTHSPSYCQTHQSTFYWRSLPLFVFTSPLTGCLCFYSSLFLLKDKRFCLQWHPRVALPALSLLYNPNLVLPIHNHPPSREGVQGGHSFFMLLFWLTYSSHTQMYHKQERGEMGIISLLQP